MLGEDGHEDVGRDEGHGDGGERADGLERLPALLLAPLVERRARRLHGLLVGRRRVVELAHGRVLLLELVVDREGARLHLRRHQFQLPLQPRRLVRVDLGGVRRFRRRGGRVGRARRRALEQARAPQILLKTKRRERERDRNADEEEDGPEGDEDFDERDRRRDRPDLQRQGQLGQGLLSARLPMAPPRLESGGSTVHGLVRTREIPHPGALVPRLLKYP